MSHMHLAEQTKAQRKKGLEMSGTGVCANIKRVSAYQEQEDDGLVQLLNGVAKHEHEADDDPGDEHPQLLDVNLCR